MLLKWSAALRISRLACSTSPGFPVTTKVGSSPRTGVLMYVPVLARRALILHPTQVGNNSETHTNIGENEREGDRERGGGGGGGGEREREREREREQDSIALTKAALSTDSIQSWLTPVNACGVRPCRVFK